MSATARRIITALLVLALASAAVYAWLTFRGTQKIAPNTVVIGWMGPLTGDAAAYGRSIQNGSLLALEEAGYKIPGSATPVKVLFEDDRAEAALGRTVFKYLAEQITTPLIVQAAGSSVMLANIPEAQARKIVYISPSCSSDRIRGAGNFIFRTWPSDAYQADFLADVVIKRFSARTAAVLYIDNAYGSGLAQAFRSKFTAMGGKVLLFEPVQVGGTDYRAQLLRLRDESPDIVFVPIQALEAARLLRQARDLRISSRFIADAVLYSQDFLANAGDAANGLYVSNLAWNPQKSGAAMDFARRYHARFHGEPDIYAAAGYDNTMVVLQALAGASDLRSGASVRASLLQLPVFHGVTGDLKFDAQGEVRVPYELNEVRAQEFVVIK